MSHSKERSEKICLNCKTELQGRYCHVCGQENIEPKETLWGLISHFFYDITHFDGKFFSTTKFLVTRPGFLSTEYVSGRRSAYLHPIRMYVFSSAIFFLIFFSLYNPGSLNISDNESLSGLDSAGLAQAKKIELANADTYKDSLSIEKKYKQFNKWATGYTENKDQGLNISLFNSGPYSNTHQYDSIQHSLPENNRDGWFKRMLTHRGLELNRKYSQNREEFKKDLVEKFMHSFPSMLFVSLPLYALFLKLLYVRRRKQFFYVDHVIFLIHLYIFTFLLLLVFFGMIKLGAVAQGWWLTLLKIALIVYGIYYAYKAMRNFYKQGGGKTFLKFTLFNLLCLFFLIILFSVFFALTIFRI